MCVNKIIFILTFEDDGLLFVSGTIQGHPVRPLNFKKNGQSGPSGKNLTKIVRKFQFPAQARFPHFSPT